LPTATPPGRPSSRSQTPSDSNSPSTRSRSTHARNCQAVNRSRAASVGSPLLSTGALERGGWSVLSRVWALGVTAGGRGREWWSRRVDVRGQASRAGFERRPALPFRSRARSQGGGVLGCVVEELSVHAVGDPPFQGSHGFEDGLACDTL